MRLVVSLFSFSFGNNSCQGKCVLKQCPRELIRHGHLRTLVNTGFHETHFKSPPGQPKDVDEGKSISNGTEKCRSDDQWAFIP